ncbi:hypothetical protein [Sandarakinorhabdus rubra]|uniref:hypothetical protein n=1 Tax=Sandarakinorhabdus rubra TaxID=2672568 RepID=UPI0013D97F52|nr:hypothetical protein [Sandarakinorhabdus rubra]
MTALTSEVLYRLSKSKLASFEHCPKRLWLQIHRREEARFDPDTLARFRIGHGVGAKAQQLVPDGIMVEAVPDIQAALERTASLLANEPSRPIFEATFQREDVLVRADILEPDGQGGWRAIEVKASTRVKPYQLADLATQVWVMQGCGVSVTGAFIRHLAESIMWTRPDMSAVRFRDTDVTLPIRRYLENRAAVAAAARKAIRGPEIELEMGRHCQSPFKCEFQEHCTKRRDLPLLAR